jgi:hypothetical protein
MQRDPRAWLWDVREAARAIESFVADHDAASYAASELVRSAVERKFEVIGEALNQLARAGRPGGLTPDHGQSWPPSPHAGWMSSDDELADDQQTQQFLGEARKAPVNTASIEGWVKLEAAPLTPALSPEGRGSQDSDSK